MYCSAAVLGGEDEDEDKIHVKGWKGAKNGRESPTPTGDVCRGEDTDGGIPGCVSAMEKDADGITSASAAYSHIFKGRYDPTYSANFFAQYAICSVAVHTMLQPLAHA